MTATASYIEAECTISHGGRKFESGGAFVSDQYVVGYVADLSEAGNRSGRLWHPSGRITNWHGDQTLGEITRATCWPIRSYMSDRMWQLTARINGIYYTGRSSGNGMVWKGKKCIVQS